MQLYGFSKSGLCHLQTGEKNQDHLFAVQSGDRMAVCLSDGCSSSPHGREAAEYTSTLLAQLFYANFYDLLLADANAVRRKVSAVLNPALEAFAGKEHLAPGELAATIVVLAVDRKGRYVAAHMGDGSILMQPFGTETNAYSLISGPSSGSIPHSTYLTMNANMMQHLKVYQSLQPQQGSKFLLLTDGADELLRSDPGKRSLPCAFGPELEQYLDGRRPQDDYSALLATV